MEIVNPLKEKFNTNILLRNDAKCAAIAEKEIGSIKDFNNAVFLTLGTGIGGAVYLDGEMVLSEMEIGHMVMDLNGERCTCGRVGCFETISSMRKLKNDIIERLNLDTKTTGKEIKEILENSDTYNLVKDIIDKYIYNLSEGLKNIINIFHPEIISIGGSFAHYENIFLDKLVNELNRENSLIIEKSIPIITVAKLKNEAGIIGATIEV